MTSIGLCCIPDMIQVPPDVCFSQNATFPAILGMSERYCKWTFDAGKWDCSGYSRPRLQVQTLSATRDKIRIKFSVYVVSTVAPLLYALLTFKMYHYQRPFLCLSHHKYSSHLETLKPAIATKKCLRLAW